MLLNAQPALSPTHPRLGRAAYGIDNAAHRGVLAAGGQTIAVLATGLNRRYPAAHTELLDRIGDTGLLVSELPPGVAPTRDRFIARNRLMAALSGGVVIPEAGVRSGSIATVLTARGLGREPRGSLPHRLRSASQRLAIAGTRLPGGRRADPSARRDAPRRALRGLNCAKGPPVPAGLFLCGGVSCRKARQSRRGGFRRVRPRCGWWRWGRPCPRQPG